MTQVLMISPCGTSLLTNQATNDERKLIGKYANETMKNIPEKDKFILEELIEKSDNVLNQGSINEATMLSAELNAIIKYYDGQFLGRKNDFHYLLCTDTWLGEQTATLVKSWLENHGVTAQIHNLKDLRTDNLESFQLALSDFVKWCEDTIPGYQMKQYEVVFNLTGGFKSVQGFLQTLAMFYADEAIYVFQTGDELLRLPKLPVKFVPDEAIQEHLYKIRRLALMLSTDDISDIPSTLIFKMDNEIQLSPWGEIVWGRVQKELYSQKVFDSPSKNIVFSDNFLKSIAGLPTDRIQLINQRIDDLAQFIELGEKHNKKRLDFKILKGNPVPGSTHELDAWSDQDAKRIYCHYKDKKIIIDKLDKALH